MIDSVHLTKYVIRPVLKIWGLHSENAERLVLGTACQESHCGLWLKQLGDWARRLRYLPDGARDP